VGTHRGNGGIGIPSFIVARDYLPAYNSCIYTNVFLNDLVRLPKVSAREPAAYVISARKTNPLGPPSHPLGSTLHKHYQFFHSGFGRPLKVRTSFRCPVSGSAFRSSQRYSFKSRTNASLYPIAPSQAALETFSSCGLRVSEPSTDQRDQSPLSSSVLITPLADFLKTEVKRPSTGKPGRYEHPMTTVYMVSLRRRRCLLIAPTKPCKGRGES